MKKNACFVIALGVLLFLSGCASGPQFSDIKGAIPPLAAGHGRMYFYRPSMFGGAIQPDIKLNDEVIGVSKPKGVFYVDRAPGNYKVETSTEVTRQLSLALEENQTRYIRLSVSMGFLVGHVYPELVEPAVGERELLDCKFTGTK